MRAIPLGESVNELIDYRDKQQIPATILRADFKNGRSPKERYAIGPLYAGQHVVLIDDTVVTGTSCMRYIPRLQEVGVVVDGVIACVHRLEKQDNGRVVHELLKDAYGVTLYSLTDVRTLLPTAIQLMEMGSEIQRCLETYYHKYGVQGLQLCS
jgi:orotate phosphoribosyltransferase